MCKKSNVFGKPMKVINIGLETFYHALKEQDVTAAHVEWKPPAGGNDRLLTILDKMK